jgi:transmembrane sensor
MPLSQHLQPDVSDARMARVWRNVRGRLEAAPPARRGLRWAAFGGALIAVAVVAAVAFLVPRGQGGSALENAALDTAGDTLGVTLLDGSKLTLDSRTHVQVAGGNSDAVALVVGHGRISCDVTHRPGRSFVVRASGVEVRVVGTRFSVRDEQRADGAHVEVNVERGAVEVLSERHPGQLTRVAAGQSFSEWVPAPGATPSSSAATAGLPAPTPAPTPTLEPSAPQPPAPSAVLEQRSPSDTPHAARELTPRELLDAANTARRAGDARSAADDYSQILKKFPSDGRAGLAAFELGRLRMDRLGDLAGAVQALERAVQLAPGSGFREDAMARLVTAYAGSGRSSDCTRARSAYLAAFPVGVHRDAVTRGCGTQ